MSPYAALATAPAGLMLIVRLAWGAPLPSPPQQFRGETRPAGPIAADIDPSQLCRAAIAATERTTRIPDEFLSAIGRVESGRMGGGRLNPWPWTVNAAGAGHFYPTKQAAEEAVRQFQASGVKSLDVGCLQVNLFYHPGAFPSLDQAFDPASNAAFAAGMLMDLFQTTGSWPRAAAAYHSMTPALGEAYQQKVLDAWSTPDRVSAPVAPTPRENPATRISHGAQADPVASAKLMPVGNRPGDVPALAGSFGTAPPPPELGFSRRLMRAQGPAAGGGAGRSLASYRTAPVQVAQRPPMGPPTLAR